MPLLLFQHFLSTADFRPEVSAHGAPDERDSRTQSSVWEVPLFFVSGTEKAKTGVSDVERKAGSLLLHYTLFWRACRMSIDLLAPQDARRFSFLSSL